MYLKSGMIRVDTFGGWGFIRGMAFDGSGLIKVFLWLVGLYKRWTTISILDVQGNVLFLLIFADSAFKNDMGVWWSYEK
jgi:hypothetical protein